MVFCNSTNLLIAYSVVCELGSRDSRDLRRLARGVILVSSFFNLTWPLELEQASQELFR